MWLRTLRRSTRKSRNIERRRATVAEVLEPRLAMTWAGAPPSSITPPGLFTNVVLNSNSAASGNASITSTEVDYYKFQALADGVYEITAKTPNSSLDPVVGVFSSSGNTIKSNDNISSSNKDSRVYANLEEGVTYFVGITNRKTTSKGSYTWKIDGLGEIVPEDSREQNDTFAAASNLGSITESTTIQDLVMRDGSDWFKFSTINTSADTHTVAISFTHRKGDLDMALYNSLGEVIGRSQTRNDRESISLGGLPAGTYWVRVYGSQSAFNPTYNLSINPPTSAPALPPAQVDLRGQTIKITDDVNWNEYISVQAVIANDGKTASGAFDVSWYLSQDNIASPDDLILPRSNGLGGTFRVSGVPANGTTPQFSVNLRLPEEPPVGWNPNNHLGYVIMQIDVNDEVPNEVYPDGMAAEDNNFGELGPGIDHVPVALGRKAKEPNVYNIDLVFTALSVTQQTIMKAAAHRWEQIIIGDLPDAAAQNNVGSVQIIDDLLLDVFAFAGDGVGGNLGAAGPLAEDGSGIPRISFFNIDRADLADMEEQGQLYKFAVFAIGRSLGLGTSNAWRQWLIQDPMTMQVYFAGPTATAAHDLIFGPNGFGVPVGPFGGFSYWEEGLFGDEILTPGNFDVMDQAPISIVTIGSLADMGYAVDFDAADIYMGFPMPGPMPSPLVAPLGSSSSGGSTTSGGTTSSSKSTTPDDPFGATENSPSATSVDNLMLIEVDYELYRRIKSGDYDFGFLSLDAPWTV
jgi:hypothetical protein